MYEVAHIDVRMDRFVTCRAHIAKNFTWDVNLPRMRVGHSKISPISTNPDRKYHTTLSVKIASGLFMKLSSAYHSVNRMSKYDLGGVEVYDMKPLK